MRRYLVPWLLLATVLLGCEGELLSATSGALATSTRELRFERAFVGYPTALELQVRNEGRADVAITLAAPSPFRVEGEEARVPGGGELTVRVVFDPAFSGTHQGVLQVTADGWETEVSLSGVAETAPDCSADVPCQTAQFDPAAGTCVASTLADGTRCAAPCVVDGQCQQGRCLGTAPACDDQNACTRDACDPQSGCLHLDATAECPAAEDPCKAARCDPAAGCSVADVADGTSCGPADCTTANVCLAGTCKQVSVPEGASCGTPSPCQAKGVCRAQACVLPEPAPLVPAWSYTVLSGELIFPGIADRTGALYWLECGALKCDLVSVTREGIVRFRTPLPAGTQHGGYAYATLALAGDVVLATTGEKHLYGLRQQDGAVLWQRDLHADFAASAQHLQLERLAVSGEGTVALIATASSRVGETMERQPSLLLALAGATGATRWTRQLHTVSGLIADESGDFYFWNDAPGAYPYAPRYQELFAVSPAGVERMRVQNTFGPPMATYAGRLFQAYRGWTDTTTGAGIETEFTGYARGVSGTPLLDGRGGWVLSDLFGCGDVYFESSHLIRFDGSGKVTGSAPFTVPNGAVSNTISQPVLTDARSVLAAAGPWTSTWALNAFSEEGEQVFACELPSRGEPHGWTGAALLPGRWVGVRVTTAEAAAYSIEAFDVPGLGPAKQGWSAVPGSQLGGGRPASGR